MAAVCSVPASLPSMFPRAAPFLIFAPAHLLQPPPPPPSPRSRSTTYLRVVVSHLVSFHLHLSALLHSCLSLPPPPRPCPIPHSLHSLSQSLFHLCISVFSLFPPPPSSSMCTTLLLFLPLSLPASCSTCMEFIWQAFLSSFSLSARANMTHPGWHLRSNQSAIGIQRVMALIKTLISSEIAAGASPAITCRTTATAAEMLPQCNTFLSFHIHCRDKTGHGYPAPPFHTLLNECSLHRILHWQQPLKKLEGYDNPFMLIYSHCIPPSRPLTWWSCSLSQYPTLFSPLHTVEMMHFPLSPTSSA